MKKIMIDAGHGGHDPGAKANGLIEKDLVLTIAKRIKAILDGYEDVEVRLTRSTDVFLELVDRAKLANSWKADLFMSIHLNAFNSKAQGFETFIYDGDVYPATIANQNVIHAAIIKAIGGTDRGKKRKNLSVLRNTTMPAILTETAFVDNARDAANLKNPDFLEKAAQGHADGLIALFGLKKKAAPVKVAAPKPAAGKPTNAAWGKELAESIEYVKAAGISDGSRPSEPLTRGEYFVMEKRKHDKGLK